MTSALLMRGFDPLFHRHTFQFYGIKDVTSFMDGSVPLTISLLYSHHSPPPKKKSSAELQTFVFAKSNL